MIQSVVSNNSFTFLLFSNGELQFLPKHQQGKKDYKNKVALSAAATALQTEKINFEVKNLINFKIKVESIHCGAEHAVALTNLEFRNVYTWGKTNKMNELGRKTANEEEMSRPGRLEAIHDKCNKCICLPQSTIVLTVGKAFFGFGRNERNLFGKEIKNHTDGPIRIKIHNDALEKERQNEKIEFGLGKLRDDVIVFTTPSAASFISLEFASSLLGEPSSFSNELQLIEILKRFAPIKQQGENNAGGVDEIKELFFNVRTRDDGKDAGKEEEGEIANHKILNFGVALVEKGRKLAESYKKEKEEIIEDWNRLVKLRQDIEELKLNLSRFANTGFVIELEPRLLEKREEETKKERSIRESVNRLLRFEIGLVECDTNVCIIQRACLRMRSLMEETKLFPTTSVFLSVYSSKEMEKKIIKETTTNGPKKLAPLLVKIQNKTPRRLLLITGIKIGLFEFENVEDYLSEIEFVIQEKQGGGGKERISEFWIREEKTERFLLVRFKKPPVVAFLYSDDDSFFLCLESKRNAFPFTRRNDNGECVWDPKEVLIEVDTFENSFVGGELKMNG